MKRFRPTLSLLVFMCIAALPGCSPDTPAPTATAQAAPAPEPDKIDTAPADVAHLPGVVLVAREALVPTDVAQADIAPLGTLKGDQPSGGVEIQAQPPVVEPGPAQAPPDRPGAMLVLDEIDVIAERPDGFAVFAPLVWSASPDLFASADDTERAEHSADLRRPRPTTV